MLTINVKFFVVSPEHDERNLSWLPASMSERSAGQNNTAEDKIKKIGENINYNHHRCNKQESAR